MGKKLTEEEVISRFRDVHGDKYDYSKVVYVDMNSKVTIICPEHGEFEQTPAKHINRKQGCPKCKGAKLRDHFSSTTEEFIKKAVSKHGDRYNYSKVEYVNSRTKVCIMCKKHGEFYVTPDNHLKGRGCPRCKQSRGENIIEAWLQRSNIRYERQFVLINQEIDRPSHRLVIDFFVKHKGRQYFIEYDGEQHFSPTYRFYDSMADFQMQQYRDQLLNDFCDRHKDAVTLIRVSCRQCEAEITHILSSTIA